VRVPKVNIAATVMSLFETKLGEMVSLLPSAPTRRSRERRNMVLDNICYIHNGKKGKTGWSEDQP
jgi:hypothetical protein